IIVNCQLLIFNCKRMSPPQVPFHHSSFIVHHSSQLAYIIYTSGSTGRPKGVLVEHRNVIAYLYAFRLVCYIDSTDTIIQLASYTFDLFVEEFYSILLNGGKVIIPYASGLLEMELLSQAIIKHSVTIVDTTPLLLNEFNKRYALLKNVKTFLNGGDTLKREYVENLLKIGPIYNGYGPTETTVCTAFYKYSSDEEYRSNIPIGKPIAGYSIYIMAQSIRLQPVGVGGELCISGAGVSRGYLNRPELTAEKFISLSLLATQQSSKTIYKTGDIGRWLPDGNIEFLGRIDQQVKIRGFRIELGEIENRLLSFPGIRESLVLAQEEERGDKYLCAYVVSEGSVISKLREYLAMELPDYMIPSYFVQIKKIPLTANGKIDRSALPKPELKVGVSYTAPRDEIETKLAAIWSEVLGRDESHTSQLQKSIGIDDNFFQLGGHSLKATILVAKIHKAFDVKIPLLEIFKNSRIRELSGYIKEAVQWEYKQVELAEKKEYYVLSSAQKRLHFLQQMDKESTAYNITSIMILEGIVDKDKLEQSLLGLIRRHESLRTSIEVIEEEPVQRIHEHVEFEIEQLGVRGQGLGVSRGDPAWSPFIRSFDLSQAPLLRVGLIEIEKARHIFLVDMHHIISDGISTQVLMQDFSILYAGEKLPKINVHYKDYAEWQNRERVSKKILEQCDYWKKVYEGEISVLELPTDFARPAVQGFEGNSINFEIDSETSGALKALAAEAGATLYIILLALYAVLLSKLSNQEDIVIGSPVAGRRHADVEKVIGMFVNTLALRTYPSGEKKLMDFLGEVKATALKGFENQEYQYEDLVEQVVVSRDTSHNPLFDTMLVLQNTGSQEIEMPGLNLIPYEYENKTSKFDLTLIVMEVEEKLQLMFEYSTKLFKRETVERFIVYFVNIIQGVVENRQQKISDFEIITEEEKRWILLDFNDTAIEYPKDKTINQLFEAQVDRTPDNIAAVDRSRQMTFREVNEKSSGLANMLRRQGIVPDTIAAIMIGSSIEMVIGILGILKAGAAYMPIDPEYPQERIDYMLADSNAKILLGMEESRKKIIVNCQLLIFNCKRMSPPQVPFHHS
ncbi:MAG: iturin family lipopeptide synthetase, partial [Acidobacteriota bacterium]|nr:iturin family lipopeptide synthetase [Acidobacteriota bacterium]